MSLIAEGFARWRECREAYDEVLLAVYTRAETETNGRLVNAEGRARGIDPMSLFLGPAARARRWASEELLDHWTRHPRMPFVEFERQWAAAHDEEIYA
ncbi:hypothetical protein BKA24_001664 [Microbacterium marinum]|uniref:Uncharacterized protein n=1 Tax=Microbacterium marinum TaxID=421115 RepID=A0A7W7BQG1_9MICO|nr:hypothetical protein [Microbacterium marinum]MBB4666955.1 hypothetical protein [Microbacterium marinum]